MDQIRLIQPEDLSTQEIFSMENLTNACRQVRRNNGAAGVDGVKARELPACPGEYWERLREQILDRSYKPLPAKRTDIPKPDGSMRGLNVPAARDRVIQACLANYLDYRKDFEMSNSYGFRKNRRCEQAILKGLEFMNDGYDWIVDIDLRKFFDTVDQDRLIRLIDNLFHNRDITALTRKFVRAGVMIDGKLTRTERGIPQGGPLSPILANIYLDQADKELESRGLRFTRYADDMLIYVKSEAAANRVMKSFSNYLEKKLKLEVNASKSKVARPDEVKYLGFGFTKNKREWKAIPHEKSIHEFEQKMMKLTKRNWSVSLEERMEKINQVIRGWSNYFRCAWMYKKNMRKLDSKLRRRIRAIIWKQWKSIRKKEESLIKLGCPRDKAHSYACARQGCVRCAVTFLNKYIRNIHLKKKGLLTIEEYFDTVAERFMKSFVRTAQC